LGFKRNPLNNNSTTPPQYLIDRIVLRPNTYANKYGGTKMASLRLTAVGTSTGVVIPKETCPA
jgi:hypothetical protein